MSDAKQVFVVDDNDDFRHSVAWMLRGEGYSTIEFGDVTKAITALKNCSNEDIGNSCLLLDVRMPNMSGLEFHDALKEESIVIPIVYMTGHADVPLAVEAMKKGASTFLEKPIDKQQLTGAIDSAIESANQIVATSNTDYLAKQNQSTSKCQEFRGKLETLTPREKDVLEGVVEGHVNKVIASNLDISVRTVEVHRSRVMKKLGIRTASEAVKMVLLSELVGA